MEHQYPELARLLNDAVDRRFGGVRSNLAREMDLTLSYVGRVASGVQVLSPETAFRFADIAGLEARTVLRACGYDDLVQRIERHFGPGKPVQYITSTIPVEELKLLQIYRALRPHARRQLMAFGHTIQKAEER